MFLEVSPGLGLTEGSADMAPPKSAPARRGTIHGSAGHNLVKFTIRAAPLPQDVWELLRDNLALLRQQERKSREEGRAVDADDDQDADEVDLQGAVLKRPTVKADAFWGVLEEKCRAAGGEWADVAERLWAFGPQNAGTCMLIDSREDVRRCS